VVAEKADLLLLPELFLCGYNIGEAVRQRAEPANGAGSEAIASLAKQSGCAILYGFAEAAEDKLFNSALCVAPDGRVLSHQRKLAIPPGFERRYFSRGAGCALFDYGGLTCATLICYDAEFPEAVRHVAGQGAQVVFVPTALGDQWGWVAQQMIPTRAYENGIYLAYANSAGTQNDMVFLGESVVAAPDGTEVVRAGDGAEVLYADLDTGRVKAAQARLPYLADRHQLKL
jgi:predicted amidohydrolase